MAGSGYIQVPPDSTGKQVDMVSATVGGVSVARQVFALANAADGQTIAEVVAASASTGAVGVVVRPTTATVALATGSTIGINSIGTVTVDGTVNISSMPAIGVSIGAVAISGTAIVAGIVDINTLPAVNISAMPAITGSIGINSIGTVTVTGGVAISGTAQVAIGTAINVNPIALAAGTANIGSLNHISRSVVSVIAGFYPNSTGATNTIQVADSANSALRVNVVAGAAGGVSQVDNSSFTTGAATFVPIGGIFDDASPGATSENAAAVARITSARAIHVNLRDSAGNELSAGTATVVGNVSIAGAAAISGFYPNSAGATNVIQVADSANSALRVNVVAGGTGGGNVTIGAVSAGVTFTVTGLVGLTAGTAVIGDLNAISRTVQVAIGTPFVLQGISTTVNVAVATPFTIQGISTTVSTVTNLTAISSGLKLSTLGKLSATATVAGSVGATIIAVSNGVAINISTMPAITGSIGINSISAGVSIAINAISAGVTIGINSISATVNTNLLAVSAGVAINSYYRAPAITSGSRGPTCATVSTSAAVTLIATPGAGANIYVTKIAASNLGGTFTAVRIGTSASANAIVMGVASSGGGFVMDFNPPWMISASERVLCSVKPNDNYVVVNTHFYVI